MRRWHFLVAALAVALASPVYQSRAAGADLESTFQKTASLLEPYLVLTDRAAANARSETGRAQIDAALSMLAQVTKERPDHWPSFWFIGKAHQALRDHRSAYVAFGNSLALKPPNPNVAREFVIEAICVKATSEAVAAAREVAGLHPSDSGLRANLGLALLADGQITEAKRVVTEALEMAPRDPITRALLAEITAVQSGRTPSQYCPP
jgi:Flp pilus assembly protein TadD